MRHFLNLLAVSLFSIGLLAGVEEIFYWRPPLWLAAIWIVFGGSILVITGGDE